ncbi:MAG: hypothetical protein D6784_11540 [Chloroflexi bacterium]|nr:MAG: hypothetical protein D6784_11540 [Chloroflexota bacterium]
MDIARLAATGKGAIKLEPASAEQVKQAIEKVSRITGIEDNVVTFEGRRIVEGPGFALRVNCYDMFECPNGYLLHVYMDREPNWAVAGKTIEEVLAAAPDYEVAQRTRAELVKKGLLTLHHA